MKLVFTSNKTLVSKIIRVITREDVSHCGFIMESIETVIHSNFLGTQPQYIDEFQSASEIKYSINVPLSFEKEIELYKSYLKKNSKRRYDFGGIIYLGIRLLLKRFFSIPVPEQNIWSDSTYDFCVEALCRLSPELTGIKESGEMLTPKGFYLKASAALRVTDL